MRRFLLFPLSGLEVRTLPPEAGARKTEKAMTCEEVVDDDGDDDVDDDDDDDYDEDKDSDDDDGDGGGNDDDAVRQNRRIASILISCLEF